MNTGFTEAVIPNSFELARTTDLFTNTTIPVGLLRAHRVASGVWARLVVHTGTVGFVFEDEPDTRLNIDAGDGVVIPPTRLYHVELDGPATFVIEFHRLPGDSAAGLETSGLAASGELDSHAHSFACRTPHRPHGQTPAAGLPNHLSRQGHHRPMANRPVPSPEHGMARRPLRHKRPRGTHRRHASAPCRRGGLLDNTQPQQLTHERRAAAHAVAPGTLWKPEPPARDSPC